MRHPRNPIQEVHIAVLGLNGSGKTALTVKYMTRRFITEYDPNLEDTYCKQELIHGREFMIWIMDTVDTPTKDANRFLPWADIFLVVYSITSLESFAYAHNMLEIIHNHAHTYCERPHTTLLLGNKTDLERYRQVSRAQATRLASEFSAEFYELNCTEDYSPVKTIFHHAIACAMNQRVAALNRSPSPKYLYASDSESNALTTSTSRHLSEPRSIESSTKTPPLAKTSYNRRSKSPAAKLHDSLTKPIHSGSPLPPLPKKSSPGLKLFKLFQN